MSPRVAPRLVPFGTGLTASACFGVAISTVPRQTDDTQHTRQTSNRKGSAPR